MQISQDVRIWRSLITSAKNFFSQIKSQSQAPDIKQTVEDSSKRWEYQTTWPVSWEICLQVKKQQLGLDMEQWTGSNWERSSQGCILSPCLFNLYVEHIMQNARLDEAQAGIKIAGENINNLRYANDITLMAETKEELKSLLMKEKEESEKAGLKLNIQKTKIMASGPITLWQIDGKQWKQWQSLFFWSPKSLQMVAAAMKLKDTSFLEEKLWPT